MHTLSEYLTHARVLRANIVAAPDVILPRREVLLEWLEAFLRRGATPSYALGSTEAADLAALDQFLRTQNVPAA